tara:strand:+ start:108 stop:224 length:117 start_codon:yes stop_codon:yes gene_type:complete
MYLADTAPKPNEENGEINSIIDIPKAKIPKEKVESMRL